jgi:lysyl-tRNA synthetase class 2
MSDSSNTDLEHLHRKKPVAEIWQIVTNAIRCFFNNRGYLEVSTPIRILAPALEEHIDAQPSGSLYLRTSPELHMKRLLAAGYDKIFQIGPCFRKGEQGQFHHPEYTMLEWYRKEANYVDILRDTQELIKFISQQTTGNTLLEYKGNSIDLTPPWKKLTVSEAFIQFAGWNPAQNFDATRFDTDLVEKVEPSLPKNSPIVLTDYPAPLAAFSKVKHDDHSIAERWELHIGGLELANAYSELTDMNEQITRFEDCIVKRQKAGKEIYPIDQSFINALAQGIPSAGGIAMGIDRLVMLLANASSIDEVLLFAES